MSNRENGKLKLKEVLAGESRAKIGKEFIVILLILIVVAAGAGGGFWWYSNRKMQMPEEISKFDLKETVKCEEVYRTAILDRLMPIEFKYKKIFQAHCRDTDEVRAWIKATKVKMHRCKGQKYSTSNLNNIGVNPCTLLDFPNLPFGPQGECLDQRVTSYQGQQINSEMFYEKYLKERLLPPNFNLTEDLKPAYYKWIKYLTLEVITDYDMPEHICQKSVQILNFMHHYLLTSGK